MAHILLVEDDSDIMRINQSFLEKEGYDVHCADSVQQAAFLLEECVPDLVLLDVMLPDGDGMDFCTILRQKTQAPVIFLTARDENDDVIKGRYGYTIYNDGTWSGTLNTLEPGQGYMYGTKSRTPRTLVFQTGRGETTIANITPENNFFQPVDDYADNMTLTAIVELDGEELRSDDYELAAFVGDECRGSVKLMYVEPIDRYIAFLTVFGDQEEELRFVLTDGENMSWSDDPLAFAIDGMSGTLTEPATLHFGTSVQDYVNIFPNPSNGVFNIEGKGIRKVSVIDTFGQVVLSKEVSNDAMQIDLNGKAAGIYMLQIVTENGISVRKLIKK